MNLEDLPRVSLDELLQQGYAPVLVGRDPGNEFVVIAPEGSALDAGPGAPITHMTHTEYGKMMADRAARGRPTPDVSTADFPAESDFKIGVGQATGATVVQRRVDLARNQGVGSASPVPNLGSELGSAVPSPFTSWMRREYNKDLYGTKGLMMYDRMRKSDGTVRGTLRLAKTPVLAGQYSMKPASTATKDQKIADFIWKNLTKWMTSSWPQTLTESLLMLEFGYYMFEEVFAPGEQVTNDPDARGKIVWKKWAPRHPMDVKEWFFDVEGGPLSVDMYAPPVLQVGLQGGIYQGYGQWINIPINKLLVFTFDKEAGNIEGISLLRSAYKHWYYKDNLYKIDAIQKERHGIGVPVVTLPMGYSPDDLALADSLGRNLRTNDRAHVVLPPNWALTFAELKGQPVDCIRSIQHHDEQIKIQILGQFLQTNMKTDEADQTLFLKATRFTADIVVDVINSYAIPQLVNMNWAGAQYPELIVKRIGEMEDQRTQSFALRNYVGAGLIVPDQPLEDYLRDELGLPPSDPETARLAQTKFNQNIANPPPFELPGTPEDMIAALKSGEITMEQLQQMQNQQQPTQGQGAQAGMPRQGAPSAPAPSTGKGDSSGTSGRRGQ